MDENVTKEGPRTLSVPEAGRKYFNLGRNAHMQQPRAATSR
jgi:hypothetical protein